MKTPFLLLILSFTILYISSCHKHHHGGDSNELYTQKTGCDSTGYTYNLHAKSILNTHCAYNGCHAGAKPKHGLDLSNYENASTQFNEHNTLCTINQDKDCMSMPPSGKLSDNDIIILTCWAKNGFKE